MTRRKRKGRKWPKISDDPRVQRQYEKMRARGESHNIAEILATRQVPGSNTDRELFAGKGTLRDQFRGEEHLLSILERNARREGISLNDCSLYEPALARYPLDPKACVPPSEGRSYIRKVCTEYGWGCEGIVNVKPSGPSIAELDAHRKEKPDGNTERRGVVSHTETHRRHVLQAERSGR